MIAAVIDVGANTLRLVVFRHGPNGLVTIHQERCRLGLGEDVERHGLITARKLDDAAGCAAGQLEQARSLGAGSTEILVTSPGRQAQNAGELRRVLEAATGAQVRVLSAEEEGLLAFAGATAELDPLPDSVAVCDVGGGSTQLVVGTAAGPAWVRSLEIGSLRLTERLIGDPPGREGLDAAAAEVQLALAGAVPPLPKVVLATGGSARALRKIAGRRLDERALRRALRVLAKRPAEEIAAKFGLEPGRARTLPAGAVILEELHALLGGLPLEVARGGVREGAALELFRAARAA